MKHSIVTAVPRKPSKPRDDFPLFPHRNGRWAKKVRGKFCYFGKWADDPKGEKAALLWAEQKDDLLVGRKPRGKRDGLTVAELVNRFLAAKERLVATGELRQRTWQDYLTVGQRIARVFGRDRLVSDLVSDDFGALRADFAKTRGPYALVGDITRTRILFKWGYDEGLFDAPMRYGQSFDRPNPQTLRLAKADNGPREFTANEIRRMIDAATKPLAAAILLGINGGIGNQDLADLPFAALDLGGGWLDFRRSKTGIGRRIPLWAETVKALREAIAQRPAPADKADVDCVFLTIEGHRLVRDRKTTTKDETGKETTKFVRIDQLTTDCGKLLRSLKINGRKGLGFYALRHTFRTVAVDNATPDETAASAIMGHAPKGSDMGAVYRHRIADARLLAVVDHVHGWLFAGVKGK